MAETMENSPREKCGIFGVYGLEDAASTLYNGLFSLQHRGQEGAGIVVSDGQNIRSSKGCGLVSEVFSSRTIKQLKGNIGIGHVRYSTTGDSCIENVQPIIVQCIDGTWAVAHNGNLVNADSLRQMYEESGSIFQTTTDSEVLLHILADPIYRHNQHRIARALAQLRGAFAFLLMRPSCVIAARDPWGYRPLSIGKCGNAWFFASETCALKQTGAQYIRDLKPGEMVIVNDSGLHSEMFVDKQQTNLSQCLFEMIYFARPDSTVFGHNVHNVRSHYGCQLAREHYVEADIVIPVPDSGNSAALGYSRESGIPLDYGFIRNHYVGRTFIMPNSNQRKQSLDMKLSVLPDVVNGKRIIVVDDSIVRGNTARQRIHSLRKAGAKEIHLRIASPPTRFPCFYGIDFATREELIAAGCDIDEVRRFIGADTLGYLSIEGVLSAFKNRNDYCIECFNGKRNVAGTQKRSKSKVECTCTI
ncbi:amidophosphoribosyltransferase [Chitinispirillales bacterium ANBcel5]|uniref:amidophosphoribosyltransferase n=1 Tax=Cellulosispirillum alkaliphilum TaxID=3039283 RepID=UPI002A590009|nr:amidophosphoribosyltransferase [Chitinispirillales bacterium ANBcel5]